MTPSRVCRLLFLAACGVVVGPAAGRPAEEPSAAAPEPSADRPTLTGDWLGGRPALRDRGLTWDVSTTDVVQGVTRGGLARRFRYGGRTDAFLTLDGEAAGLWRGLTATLHGEALYGRSVNAATGSLAPAAHPLIYPLDAPPQIGLTTVLVGQAVSESLQLFAGKLNTFDDYTRTFRGNGLGTDGFLNGGFLYPPVLGRTEPYSAFAAGAVVSRDGQPVLEVTVHDTHNTPTVAGFDTFLDDGVMVLVEATRPTRLFGRPGRHTLGGAYSTGRYALLDPEPFLLVGGLRGVGADRPQRAGSWALFYEFDQAVGAAAGDPARRWGVFGSGGLSDGNPNPVRWSADVGVGGASPLPGRPRDAFGVGYYYLGVSGAVKRVGAVRLPVRDEHGVEVFYSVGVTPWFHLTPDLQVLTPARAGAATAVNVALRARVVF